MAETRVSDPADVIAGAKGGTGRRSALRAPLEPLAVMIVGVLCWEAAVRFFEPPTYLVPLPSAVLAQLWFGLSSGLFVFNTLYTAGETVAGFVAGALIGVVLGGLISQFDVARRFVLPFIVALQTVPKVAIAPLIIVWFGFGAASKIVIATLICFFPIVINTIEGLNSVRPELIMLLRSYKASRWEIFRTVQLPHALPNIFAGLHIGIVLAVIGTIVGEFLGATYGLGRVLSDFTNAFQTDGVFATVTMLALMGLGFHAILAAVRRRVVFWQPTERSISA